MATHELTMIPEDKMEECKTLNDALVLSWHLSGLPLKQLAYELGESERSLSRILRRNTGVIRFLDQEKLCLFIQACGNAAVPQFLAKALGGEFVTKGKRTLIEEIVREVCRSGVVDGHGKKRAVARFRKNLGLGVLLEAAGFGR